jgi:PAS domain S-box-containing protein
MNQNAPAEVRTLLDENARLRAELQARHDHAGTAYRVEEKSSEGPGPLDESLAHYLLEQVSEAVVVCDASGTVIKANGAASTLALIAPSGKPFLEGFRLEDKQGEAVALTQLFAARQEAEFCLHRQGQRLRLLVRTTELPGGQGQPRFVIILSDVTAIRRSESEAEQAKRELEQQLDLARKSQQALLSVVEDVQMGTEALRESEARFRLALHSVPIIVWTMDADLRYQWAYDQAAEERVARWIGLTDEQVYGAEDAQRLLDVKRRVLASGERWHGEMTLSVDGEQSVYDFYIEPTQNDQGEIDGVTGAMVDITTMRLLEFEKVKLGEALRQSGSATVIADVTRKVEFANTAYEQLFGYHLEEIVGRPVAELVNPDKSVESVSVEQIFAELEKGGVFRGEVIRRTKGGELIPLLITAAPVNTGQGVSGYVASYSDLSAVKQSEKRLREALVATILAISHTVEKRDPYTAGHQQRVAELATTIGREMQLPLERIEGIYLGSLIHDIGKIYIPAEILNRPGKLSEYEFGMIRSHPDVGFEIVKDVKFEWPIANIVHQHHECMNGTGYPRGLKGDEICLEARIVAVADIVEAMSSHRPYRPGLGLEAAMKEIEQQAGTRLDADVVECCLKLFREQGFNWGGEFVAPL